MKSTIFIITAILLHTTVQTTSHPSTPQSWASHKRALLQLQNDIATTSLSSSSDEGGNATSPLLDAESTLEQKAEQLLELLVTSIKRHSGDDVDDIALKLFPNYITYFQDTTTTIMTQLKALMRRLYLTHYGDLELELMQMDKLGLLMRRLQRMTDVDEGSEKKPSHHHHQHHHDRRRPGPLPALKRVDGRREPMWRKWVDEA